MSSCVFCRIVEGEEKAFKIFEDDVVLVILDKYPLTLGHSLVITKKHFDNFLQLDRETAFHVVEVARAVAKASLEALNPVGVNILTNIGRGAGQIIFHAHVHIIPRYESDNLRFINKRLFVPDGEKSAIAERIKIVLEKYLGYSSR